MRYIAAEDIAKAKEMDLLTYLRNYEPQELVHVSGNTYCTREHDSLRISNGKWCWFSQGIGGRSALDYLIKVKGIDSITDLSFTVRASTIVKRMPSILLYIKLFVIERFFITLSCPAGQHPPAGPACQSLPVPHRD